MSCIKLVNMRIEYLKYDVEVLRTLAESWLGEQATQEYGVKVDVDVIMAKLADAAKHDWTELIISWHGPIAVGVYAIFRAPSFFGEQQFALGLYWYVMPEFAGHGLRLLREAKKWAAANGCSHFMPCVSMLAGRMYNDAAKILKLDGYRKFESVYVIEV